MIETKIKREIVKYFVRHKDVVCVYLFGSTVSGKMHSSSDVDIAVLLEQSLPQTEYSRRNLLLMDDLSQIMNKDIDIVILNNANCFLKYQIIKNGFRIYEHRKNRKFEARAIVEYFDFLPIRQRLEQAFIRHIRET